MLQLAPEIHKFASNFAINAVRSTIRSTKMLSSAACAPSPIPPSPFKRRNPQRRRKIPIGPAAGKRFLDLHSRTASRFPPSVPWAQDSIRPSLHRAADVDFGVRFRRHQGQRTNRGCATCSASRARLSARVFPTAWRYSPTFSGATHGFMIAHAAPEAFNGGPIAFVHEGDTITVDAGRGVLDLCRSGAPL